MAPPALPNAKRRFDQLSPFDLSDFSIRFFGVLGTKRLLQTIALSNGLSSATNKKIVPTRVFPSGGGRKEEGKTPRVSKGKLMHLHTGSVGEVVFADTFESGDSWYK